MARSVVLLPAPFEPMSATISPGIDVERDAVQRFDLAVADHAGRCTVEQRRWRHARLDDAGCRRRSSNECSALPRYASITRWFDWTLSGVPSAIFLP